MKKEDVASKLGKLDLPNPEGIAHQQELKIPLLSYKRSSKAGLLLLLPPAVFVLVVTLKYQFMVLSSPFLNGVERLFHALSDHWLLSYLIPVIFVGLPLVAMIVNFLAICHFAVDKETKELLITVKNRPLNLAIFLLAFAVLVYAFLPDALP